MKDKISHRPVISIKGCGIFQIISDVLKVPYSTPFWSFVLGFDVLTNKYLQYKY